MAEHGYLRKATSESTSAKSNHFLQTRPFENDFEQDTAASEREVGDLEAASNTTANPTSASSSVETPPSLPNNTFHFSNINVLQPKLTIGLSNDPLVQEADQVAHGVMRKIHSGSTGTEDVGANGTGASTFPQPHPLLMRQPVQRDDGIVSGPASNQFENQLNQSRGGGSPLEPNFRGQLESAMGADLHNVKVHTDTKADQLSQSIQAKAFTTGSDIFFKQGEYNPGSRSGQELIAHEVTHTLQQGATQQVGDVTQRRVSLIQRVTEDEPLVAPTGTDMGKAFKSIVDSITDYNTETLNFSPQNEDDPDQVRKQKLNVRLTDLSSIQKSIDTWMTGHPEIENTWHSNKTSRLRRNAKRESMQQLQQSVIELREYIQGALQLLKDHIATEKAFEEAPLQSNPGLKQQDEQGHQFKESQSAITIFKGGNQVYFPLTQTANFPIQNDSQVHQLGPVEDNNWPNYVSILFVQGPWINQQAYAPKSSLLEFKEESERFGKVDVELFPDDRDPDPNDVKQTNLGDCYLQAALASIAATRPQYIKQIMRDQGDTVTVRLHEVDRNSETFTQKYIKVEKSIPKSKSGRKLYNDGELWVKMMQKAYVVGGFSGNQNDDQQSSTPSYGDIAGGLSSHAFEVILGAASTFQSLAKQSDNDPMGQTLTHITEAFENNGLSTSGTAYQAVFKILLEKEGVRQNVDPNNGDVAVQITLDEVENAFQNGSQEEQTKKEAVLKVLANYLPGKLGKGQYTELQTGIFTKIHSALDDGKPVTMSTHKFIEASNSGFDGFAGEQKKGGLAGRHAYSVLQVCTSNDISSPSLGKEDGKYKLLQLRNPWGQYGREYQNDFHNIDNQGNVPVKTKSKNDGVFWIELSEVSKYFDGLSVGAHIPTN